MRLLRNYVPALKFGAKITPQDLAGMLGLPHVGNIWFVDPTNGSDTANSGSEQNNAFKTLYAAHNAATANNHDVILLVPAGVGTGTGTDESVAVSGGRWTFSKSLTHVIGNCAPSMVSPRARVLWGTASQSTSTNALLTISASGCIFANLQFGTFVDNNVLVKVTGDRNYFNSVHFAGIGDATAGDDTDAKSLWLADGDENVFESCYVGLDTVARSVANCEIQIDGGSQRNIFRNSLIVSFADNAGHFFVSAPTSGELDRWVLFENCGFINPINSTATTMTDAMNVHSTVGGSVILINSWKIGATGWADNLGNIQALAVSSNSTYNQGIGFPVNPAA